MQMYLNHADGESASIATVLISIGARMARVDTARRHRPTGGAGGGVDLSPGCLQAHFDLFRQLLQRLLGNLFRRHIQQALTNRRDLAADARVPGVVASLLPPFALFKADRRLHR